MRRRMLMCWNLVGLVLCALAWLVAGCDRLPQLSFSTLLEARRVTAELLADVSEAEVSTNRAVMAETDEQAAEFARESRAHTEAVQRKRDQLETMLRELHYGAEVSLLGEFRQALERSRALDDEILGLAVENTNLKAQRLSFGPAREAADAFADALETVTAKGQPTVRIQALQAVLGVRDVQILQAPHIAAAEADVMTALEKQMAAAQAHTRAALDELRARAAGPALDAAEAALASFTKVHTELLALSRRNSDVRSLALALGQKRAVTAACEGMLRSLGERLAKYQYPAHR